MVWTASFITLAVVFGTAALLLYGYCYSVIRGLTFFQSLETVSLAASMVLSFPGWIASAFALWKIDKMWAERKHRYGMS